MGNLRIDSYEPFIIGLKLSPELKIDKISNKLRNTLNKNGFKVAPNQPPNGEFSITFGPPIETLGLKNNSELKINLQQNSILIEGENPDNVIEILNEIPKLFEQINLEFNDSFIFFELMGNIILETDHNPREIINDACNINLNNLIETDCYVSGLKINSIVNSNQKLIGLIIEPRAGNPNKFYYINFIYRTDNLEDLLKYNNVLSDKIKEVINSLED